MRTGDRLKVEGGDLAFGGETACRDPDSGIVVFVPLLAPGDLAVVRIEHVRRNFARGRVLDVVRPGPDRVKPACPVFGFCGGCQWQHVSLAAQRAAKERIVRRVLEQAGLADRLEPIAGMPEGYRYRNRLLLPVRAGTRGLRAGFFRARTHRIVEVGSCAVQDPRLGEAAAEVVRIVRAAGIAGYRERTGAGVLRHLLIRIGAGSGEIGVLLVTASRDLPGGEALAREMMRRNPAVVGVAQNVNPARTNVIISPEVRVLAGRGWVVERIANLELKSSLETFFQANPPVTERMAGLVRGWVREEAGGLLDLYCGGGLFGLAAIGGEEGRAPGAASWLVGVEESPAAVADARENARGDANAHFEAGAVEDLVPRLRDRLAGLATAVVDPPRKGLTPEALRVLVAAAPRQIIYVSCDPMTFGRDLAALRAEGYVLEKVAPFDMFPQTYHVELAARFWKRG